MALICKICEPAKGRAVFHHHMKWWGENWLGVAVRKEKKRIQQGKSVGKWLGKDKNKARFARGKSASQHAWAAQHTPPRWSRKNSRTKAEKTKHQSTSLRKTAQQFCTLLLLRVSGILWSWRPQASMRLAMGNLEVVFVVQLQVK